MTQKGKSTGVEVFVDGKPIPNERVRIRRKKINRRHVVNRCDDLEVQNDILDERVGALEAAAADLVNLLERMDRDRVSPLERVAKRRTAERVEEGRNADAVKLTAADLVARVEFLEAGLWARFRRWIRNVTERRSP